LSRSRRCQSSAIAGDTLISPRQPHPPPLPLRSKGPAVLSVPLRQPATSLLFVASRGSSATSSFAERLKNGKDGSRQALRVLKKARWTSARIISDSGHACPDRVDPSSCPLKKRAFDHERRRLQKLTATDKCVRRSGRTSPTDEKRMSGLSALLSGTFRAQEWRHLFGPISRRLIRVSRLEPRRRCWVSTILVATNAASSSFQRNETHRIFLSLSLSFSEKDISRNQM